jgi:malonyl-CoA O-methyltransferase
MTFEIVYGHALRPAPRVRLQPQAALSVDDMRSLLHAGRRGAK